jgi:hypothetical protein
VLEGCRVVGAWETARELLKGITRPGAAHYGLVATACLEQGKAREAEEVTVVITFVLVIIMVMTIIIT